MNPSPSPVVVIQVIQHWSKPCGEWEGEGGEEEDAGLLRPTSLPHGAPYLLV